MVRIRMKRFGTKSQPKWRVVVAQDKSPRDGRFIEEIGYYNPLLADEKLEVKKDRYDYWVKKGAQPTQAIKSLLKRAEKKAKKAAA